MTWLNDTMTYRLVICVDAEAKDLEDAYGQVYKAMGEVEKKSEGKIQWESTDEWFEPGGDQGDPDKLQEARMAVIDKEAGDADSSKR